MNALDFSRVLTTGAHGMIGSYVDFGMRPDRQTLDVLDEESVMRYVQAHTPQVILHLAAATDMARCEHDPDYAYALNVRGTYAVARAAKSVGATMVYVSTSRVFNGDKQEPYTEADSPDPETHYGKSKHIGEIITAALVPRHIIARTAWVFGGGKGRDNKFYGTVLEKLYSGDGELVGLADVQGSPTYAKDFVAQIKALLAEGAHGTFHIANAGVASRFDLVTMMAKQVRPDMVVHAVDRSYFATGASLPTNEAVTSARCVLRPWEEALAEYIDAEWTSLVK